MTQENMQDLRDNTVQGYGIKAWHFDEATSREPFAGEVPEQFVADLFPEIEERPLQVQAADGGFTEVEGHKGLVRADTDQMLALANESYTVHQYSETLLGMGLPIAAAGLLKGGRYAWVQYGTPDTVLTPENVKFTTKLLTATSVDGTLATQFRHVTTLAVCDNTLAVALSEGSGLAQKVRHTRFSVPRVDTMREAFGLIDDVTEQVVAQIADQTSTTVTDAQIGLFLDQMLPASKVDAEEEGRARTIAINKRDAVIDRLNGMWSDYSNTQFGVLQAYDTALRWDFRTTDEEKVMTKTISGEFDKAFTSAYGTLDKVLVSS